MQNNEQFNNLVASLSGSLSYISNLENYEMLHMTPQAMELFGIEKAEDYCGKKCYELLHGAEYPCAFCTNGSLKTESACSSLQYNSKLKKWLILNNRLSRLNGHCCRVEQVEEIPDGRPWTEELTERLKTEDVLLQCAQALSSLQKSQDAMATLLEMVGRFYCADRAYIFEFNKPLGVLNNTYEWCAEGVSQEKENLQAIPLEVISGWLTRFREQGQIYIPSVADLDHESKEYQLLEMQKISSLLAVPLYADGDTTGFVGVDNPKGHLSSLNLLGAVSGFIVAELDKRRNTDALEYDWLTGTYTRYQYDQIVAHYNKIRPESLGVVRVDVNGMKLLNETFGSQFGDQLLKQTAQILLSCISPETYRISGDEFAVLCPNMDKRLFELLLSHVRVQLQKLPDVSFSIGSCYRETGTNIEEQLHVADKQLLAEKQLYYYKAMESGQPQRRHDATDLLEELRDGLFETWCQPQVDIRTGEITGVEMLIRKHDREGNLISPSQFVPHYEARGLMIHIDFYVLEQAAALAKTMRELGLKQRVSVNFSRSSLLVADFAGGVEKICRKYETTPSILTIEITESVADMDKDAMTLLMAQLKAVGCRISLDDFGTEYSNLAILADYEFDEVKFDKTLIDGIADNPKAQFLCKNMFAFCKELQHADIVMEGIETADQAAFLKEVGCKYGQGFFYHKPMTKEQFVQLLQTQMNAVHSQ